jgi:hypothetical protein
MSNDTVTSINRRIRRLINEPRLNRIIRQEQRDFNRVASALDVIDDSQSAIDAYSKQTTDIELGQTYLSLYGVFQAVILQQDALSAMEDALKVTASKALTRRRDELRRKRHDTVGHPTERRDERTSYSHQIIQNSLTRTSFELIRADNTGGIQFEQIDVRSLIADQSRLMVDGLLRLERELRVRNEAHRTEFRDVKFVEIIKQLDYPIEKVLVGNSDPSGPRFVLGNISVISKAIAKFRAELERRGISGGVYEGVEHCLEDLEYTLEQLDRFFRGESEDIRNDRGERIYAEHLRSSIQELRAMATELDDDYSRSDPTGPVRTARGV